MTPAISRVAEVEQRASDIERHMSGLTSDEIFSQWSSLMGELYRRGLIRTFNNPVADLAESLVAKLFGLELVANSTLGYDARGPDGARYQIKSRRLLNSKASRQLGVMRGLDQRPFDYLLVVLVGPNFELQELWKIPVDVVHTYARYQARTNSYILHARGAVLNDPGTSLYDATVGTWRPQKNIT